MKWFLLLLILVVALPVAALPPAEDGKTIFTARCASCHSINKALTGPALAGISKRRSMDWIVAFVQSSQAMVQKGDKEAVALFNQYNHLVMPDHPDLDRSEIEDIVAYISTNEQTAEKPPFERVGKRRPAYVPLTWEKDKVFFAGFGAAVLVLIWVLLMGVRLKDFQRRRTAAGA